MVPLLNKARQVLPQSVRSLLKRGLFHARNRSFKPYVASFEREGTEFKFFVGDHVGGQWLAGGWDWHEIGYLRDNLVKEGDVVFECGAHHGELTLFLSKWVGPSGRVISFEPVPRNVEIINRQIELNTLENVTVINAAVGARPARVRVTDESNAQVSEGPGIEIDVVRLDDYAHLGPTMLKIDVEGYEAEVLRGAQAVLNRRPRISLEVHTPSLSRYGTTAEEVLRLVGAENYAWKVQASGDRFIVDWDGDTHGRVVHLFGTPK